MNRFDKSASEYIRIIGEERTRHSPEEIAEAETALRDLVRTEYEKAAERMPRVGKIVAWIGVAVGLFPVMVLALMLEDVLSDAEAWRAASIPSGAGLAAFVAAAVVQTACGLALVVGGIHFRKAKEWARKTILSVLWLAFGYCVLFGFAMVVATPFVFGWSYDIPIVLVGGLAIVGFWLWILRLPLRYFSSREVVAACRGDGRGA